MKPTVRILLVALAAGALGVGASLLTSGPGPLLRTAVGQRLLGAVLSARAPNTPSGLMVAKQGQPIPAMVLADLQGRPVSLPAAYRGRPLLINVWASWCAPCVKEMPELEAFSHEQDANGIQIIGIALDDPPAVRAFLGRVGVTYPILVDTPGPRDAGVQLGNAAGVLPYSVLISADGVLLRQRIGPFAPGEIGRWSRP
ncbi:MAG TPA: TlpA disulfide reductase family protein [Luteimonas sp.]|nr:TlpA disulfide reductase family protein [Luteimonas sp.]